MMVAHTAEGNMKKTLSIFGSLLPMAVIGPCSHMLHTPFIVSPGTWSMR